MVCGGDFLTGAKWGYLTGVLEDRKWNQTLPDPRNSVNTKRMLFILSCASSAVNGDEGWAIWNVPDHWVGSSAITSHAPHLHVSVLPKKCHRGLLSLSLTSSTGLPRCLLCKKRMAAGLLGPGQVGFSWIPFWICNLSCRLPGPEDY